MTRADICFGPFCMNSFLRPSGRSYFCDLQVAVNVVCGVKLRPDRPDRTGPTVTSCVTFGVTLHRLGGPPEEFGSENVGIDVTK